jgi:hypothetical protein
MARSHRYLKSPNWVFQRVAKHLKSPNWVLQTIARYLKSPIEFFKRVARYLKYPNWGVMGYLKSHNGFFEELPDI